MTRLLTILALLLLAGCKSIALPGFSASADRIGPVPSADARLLFNAPVFADRAPIRAKFTDQWQREEYALFRGAQSQAEMIYIAATARETALVYETGLKSMIRTWNHNADKEILWGREGKALSAFGDLFVLPFAHSGNACFGFSAEWAVAIDDPGLSPTKAMFGYYCEASKTTLTADRIESLIETIEVSRFAGGSTTSTPPKTPVTKRGGTTGNPNYPFLFAQGYISEGTSFVDRSY